MSLLLGCIADDVSGATDLSLMLGKNGMSVVQILGRPQGRPPPDADAIVVALKTRTAATAEAVTQSLDAARWLREAGVRQFFFKYCSTFDSTSRGNIGPVAETLLEFLESDFTIVCPAFPDNQRTVYQGHLFVGAELLSESAMRNHPLTPMTDSNLIRLMDRQCRNPGSVGLVPYETVEKGPEAIRDRFEKMRQRGYRFAVVDSLTNRNLFHVARASENLPLVTGGSAMAMGLPANFRRAGRLQEKQALSTLPRLEGPAAVLSGSCSPATREQVEEMSSHFPAFALDPIDLAEGRASAADLLQKVRAGLEKGAVLVFSTTSPQAVQEAQERLGQQRASELIERTLSELAVGLVTAGVRKLLVAGGESSGAVAQALGLRRLRIGPEIAPGVPWTTHLDSPELLVAFKSGNFGERDFFIKALEILP